MPFDDNKLYCSEVLSILLQNHEGELQRDCVYTRVLTFSLPIPVRLYTLPYWSNPQFLIIDIRALRTERPSAWMSEIKNGGLDQYGTKPFKQQQFGTAGVEGVNVLFSVWYVLMILSGVLFSSVSGFGYIWYVHRYVNQIPQKIPKPGNLLPKLICEPPTKRTFTAS